MDSLFPMNTQSDDFMNCLDFGDANVTDEVRILVKTFIEMIRHVPYVHSSRALVSKCRTPVVIVHFAVRFRLNVNLLQSILNLGINCVSISGIHESIKKRRR